MIPNNEREFKYLDWLRESGQTNMFGAGVYLERRFSISPQKAREVLRSWMETFDKRHPEGDE